MKTGAVVERLSFDAWGKRRQPNGADDPSGSVTSSTTKGFTGHEELDSVGLVHMNGRVYDPIIGRFGQADPVTESPFSTQGWNRYSYVGNSPTNFTDPSGYCFMGCFWKGIFKGLGNFLRNNPIIGDIFKIVAAMACGPGFSVCAVLVAAATSFAITGLASGNLGLALRAGFIAAVTVVAFHQIGEATGHRPAFGSSNHLANIAGHAAIGCAAAAASGGSCKAGAMAGAAGSFASPLLARANLGLVGGTIAHGVVGGLASVAGGGKFGNGAVTAAFGYLYNELGKDAIDKLFDFGKGHHVAPRAVVQSYGGVLSAQAVEVFGSHTIGPNGELNGPGNPHKYDGPHRAYSQGVRGIFSEYISTNNISSENPMTRAQAYEVLGRVQSSPDQAVRGYLRTLHDYIRTGYESGRYRVPYRGGSGGFARGSD